MSILYSGKMKPSFLYVLGALCIFAHALSFSSYGQEKNKPTIDMWGVFQPRLSYGASDDTTANVNRAGFGIKRARLRVEVGLNNKIGVRYDSDFASGVFQTVDLFAFYRVSPNVQLRVGIMPSAQPRAHIFTPIPLIDGFDRAAIAEQWGAATLGGGGRDFGMDVQYQTDEWTLVGFLHNGDGSFSKTRGNFSQTISSESATNGVDQTSLATSFYAAHRVPGIKGVEVGGYLSFNPTKNANTVVEGFGGRKYFSYATHAYYGAEPGSQPFRLKFDLIGINYEGAGDQKRLGMSFLGAVSANEYLEFFGRYENIKKDVNFDADNFWSAGVTFSLSKFKGGPFSTQRATLGYSMLDTPEGAQEHLVVLQWLFIL
ncbi:MAG: hypothetical protein AB8G77_23335 [Rhodothermales bacterium]